MNHDHLKRGTREWRIAEWKSKGKRPGDLVRDGRSWYGRCDLCDREAVCNVRRGEYDLDPKKPWTTCYLQLFLCLNCFKEAGYTESDNPVGVLYNRLEQLESDMKKLIKRVDEQEKQIDEQHELIHQLWYHPGMPGSREIVENALKKHGPEFIPHSSQEEQ